MYAKYSPKLTGKRSIQNIEAALALQFLEEILQNIRKLPRKVQQEIKKAFSQAGETLSTIKN